MLEFKEEALDRTLWRTGFGRGYGFVVRQATERMNEGRKKEGRMELIVDISNFFPWQELRKVLCLRLTVTYVSSYAKNVFSTGMWHILSCCPRVVDIISSELSSQTLHIHQLQSTRRCRC